MLAEVHAIQQVIAKEQCISSSNSNHSKSEPAHSKMEFDFGDSPVPPEWKDKVTSLLNSMPEVFAQNDLDFGHTNKVKHHIKLSDETQGSKVRPIWSHMRPNFSTVRLKKNRRSHRCNQPFKKKKPP